MEPTYEVGDEVQSVIDPSKTGTVVEICEEHAGEQWYRVNFGSRDRPKMAEDDLRTLKLNNKPDENLKKDVIDGYREFQRLLTFHRLVRDHPLKNNIYAFNASRIKFYPHQFKPLIKFLNSPKNNLLIADEVGLGKTIEACLILTELRARQEFLDRILVVCPAKLQEKWHYELKQRFGEDFRTLKAKNFRTFLDDFQENPRSSSLEGIISLESIRQKDIIEKLKDIRPTFDLVIVDEAHHMRNFGTLSREVGEQLGMLADSLLFLTATPIHLGNENLYSLLNLLDEEEFPDERTAETLFKENEPIVKAQTCLSQHPPKINQAIKLLRQSKRSRWVEGNPLYDEVEEQLLHLQEENDNDNHELIIDAQRDLSELNLLSHIFTRTKKKDVHAEFPKRQAYSVKVNLTEKEKNFYQAVTDFIRLESEKLYDKKLIKKWRLIMPQRRVSSSIPAMVEYYRRNEGFSTDDVPDENRQPYIEGNDDAPETVNEARERLNEIVNTWPREKESSKYLKLKKILTQLREDDDQVKVIIFAFFKDTLRHLSKKLSEDGFRNIQIHGDVPSSKRPDLIDDFREDPGIEVLLSSRVGSEGLDFQFCDTIVNYDLPWNPMRVEQRIGRLDRIGQNSDVIRIYNLWVEETIEERMLKRLYDRIGVFEKSIGELEMIMGEVMSDLENEVLSKDLTPEEEDELIEQKLRAIEKKKADMEKLESESARFIGTDQFFKREIEQIQEKKRYVTEEQLLRFVKDFLKTNCPRTRLDYDSEKQLGELYPDQDFKSLLQELTAPGELSRLISAGKDGLPITFDSQVAFEEPDIEFINVLHPIVRGITNYYKAEGELKSNAHHVLLSTDQLDNGFYFYFIYKLRITAAREENSLEMFVLNQNFNEACNASKAEKILGEMIEKGEDPTEGIQVSSEAVGDASQAASDLFHARIDEIREKTTDNNDRYVDRQLNSLETHYNKLIQQNKKRLKKAKRKDQAERYKRMLRGTIKRLESELKNKKSELEKRRDVGIDYDEIAAGVLEIS